MKALLRSTLFAAILWSCSGTDSVTDEDHESYTLMKISGEGITCGTGSYDCRFSVRVIDQNGSPVSGDSIVWTLSNSDARVGTETDGSGMSSLSNLAAFATPTNAYQTARHARSGQSVTFSFSVVGGTGAAPVASIAVIPSSVSLIRGGAQNLSVTLTDANANVLTGRSVTFQTSNGNVATVDGSGVVHGVTAGSAVITVASESKSVTVPVNVSEPANQYTLTKVSGDGATCAPGTFDCKFTVRVTNQSGQPIAGETIRWAMPAAGSVTVPSTTNAQGEATISNVYTYDGPFGPLTQTAEHVRTGQVVSFALSFVAANNPVATISVSPSSVVIGIGATQALTVTLRDAANNVLTGRAISYSSANSGIASVGASGVVLGVASGSTNLFVTSEGKTTNVGVTVSAAAVASISVIPASVSVNVGASQALTVTLRDAASNVLTGRTVTFSTSNGSVASVDASGVVRGASAGSATVTVSSEGKTAGVSVSVTAPAQSLTIIPASFACTVGQTRTFDVALNGVIYSVNSYNSEKLNSAGMVVESGGGQGGQGFFGCSAAGNFTLKVTGFGPLAGLTATAPIVVTAAAPTTGTVTVTFRNSSGALIPNVTYTLSYTGGSQQFTTASGSTSITAVPAGQVSISGSASGYVAGTGSGVLTAGGTLSLNIVLQTGSTGTPSETGTRYRVCSASLPSFANSSWTTMPGDLTGLDVKLFWDASWSTAEVAFRNRYTTWTYLNYRVYAGTTSTTAPSTNGRVDLPPGYTDNNPTGGTVGVNVGLGGSACVVVDKVRFGTDTGPYHIMQ